MGSLDAAPPDDGVRLLICCAGDPNGERTFSGSARSLFQALERRGIVHAKGNVTGGLTDVFSPPPFHIRVIHKLDRFGWVGQYRWSQMACARNSARAVRFAKANPGYNACLMYGTNYNPRLPVPTYCYFDATSAQVFKGEGWELGRLPEAQADDVVAYQSEVFNDCTGIFPRTQWAARSVIEDYSIAEEKVCVAGAGANHADEPLPHGPYDKQNILFIGREWERKGGPVILEGFRRARKSLPNATLIVVGCAPELDEPGVEVVGPIRKDTPGGIKRIMEYYSQASLFCLMSTFEPFGIVIVEAQKSFVPCIVPDCFAFVETVKDGVTGKHIHNYDPVELGDTFVELLSDPARLEEMGRAAHAHVQASFTWDITAERIHDRILSDLRRLG